MTTYNDVLKKDSFLKILLWSARVIGALLIIYCIIMFVCSVLQKDSKDISFSPTLWNGMMMITGMCFLIGIAGLITAFIREGEGGLITLIGMTAFLILTKYNPQASFSYHYFILLLPAVLYLFYWWLVQHKKE